MFLQPNWPVPNHVKAYTTFRSGIGISEPPFDQFNLADHVGDNLDHVLKKSGDPHYKQVTITVWSTNSGSVDDFCDFYLNWLKQEPYWRWGIVTTEYDYRVANWRRYHPI